MFDACLMLVGLKLGMTFLGIKYTTYYLVFYLIGWILNLYITKQPEWTKKTWSGIAFMTLTVFFCGYVVKIFDSFYARYQ